MTQHQPDSFPQFSRLPNELKHLIWDAALEQRPAVHFAHVPQSDGGYKTIEVATSSGLPRLRKAAPPADILSNRPFTPQEALFHTCQDSRNLVLKRQRKWAPERTIQLYEVTENSGGAVPNGVQGVKAGPLTHGQRQNERYQTLDGENSLIILGDDWRGTWCCQGTCQLSVPKVGYLALIWPGHPYSIGLFAAVVYDPPPCEVLYTVFDPDDLEPDSVVGPSEAEAPQQEMGMAWCVGTGPKCPAPKTPESFWFGKREYYQISWDTVERAKQDEVKVLCEVLRDSLYWKDRYNSGCRTCRTASCESPNKRWSTVHKALTWRDWD